MSTSVSEDRLSRDWSSRTSRSGMATSSSARMATICRLPWNLMPRSTHCTVQSAASAASASIGKGSRPPRRAPARSASEAASAGAAVDGQDGASCVSSLHHVLLEKHRPRGSERGEHVRASLPPGEGHCPPPPHVEGVAGRSAAWSHAGCGAAGWPSTSITGTSMAICGWRAGDCTGATARSMDGCCGNCGACCENCNTGNCCQGWSNGPCCHC
mmetsp:Transcript_100014/g.305733  ORF Transcript_100014/g.305733 Transcript_100014/m.305733 type:complete len:214 (-) Transcript_100014:200-841(-)